MISREDTTNLSNMPAISEQVVEPSTSISDDIRALLPAQSETKWKVTKFDRTPPMSTYLAAMANGKFSYLESSAKMPISGKTVPMRIYASPDVIHQAQFALDVKAAALPLYETIFDVEYPLPKLDTLVAHDFIAGTVSPLLYLEVSGSDRRRRDGELGIDHWSYQRFPYGSRACRRSK